MADECDKAAEYQQLMIDEEINRVQHVLKTRDRLVICKECGEAFITPTDIAQHKYCDACWVDIKALEASRKERLSENQEVANKVEVGRIRYFGRAFSRA